MDTDTGEVPQVETKVNKARTSITITTDLLQKTRIAAKNRESNRSVSAVIEDALVQFLG